MLNDFGIHHLHLSAKQSPDAKYVKRSDLLLLACVRPDDAYFIDTRPHPQRQDPDDYGWSRQEYLHIINRNWKHVLDPYELRGVTGTSVTDSERKELQRKNTNVAIQIGDRTIAPSGGGTMSGGANLKHVWMAMRLRWLAEETQKIIETHWATCRRDLRRAGVQAEDSAEFRLVRLDEADLTPQVLSYLNSDLGRSGWVVRHIPSGTHINLNSYSE